MVKMRGVLRSRTVVDVLGLRILGLDLGEPRRVHEQCLSTASSEKVTMCFEDYGVDIDFILLGWVYTAIEQAVSCIGVPPGLWASPKYQCRCELCSDHSQIISCRSWYGLTSISLLRYMSILIGGETPRWTKQSHAQLLQRAT